MSDECSNVWLQRQLCFSILVYSDNAEEYKAQLCKVLDRLHEHKLQAKLKKCEFGKPYVSYLGHIVGSGELRVD